MGSRLNLNCLRTFKNYNSYNPFILNKLNRCEVSLRVQSNPYSTNNNKDGEEKEQINTKVDSNEEKNEKSKQANKKLMSLLSSINVTKPSSITGKNLIIDLAKPGGSKKLKEQVRQSKMAKSPLLSNQNEDQIENQLKVAVVDVAESLGGDVKKTESELLQKLKLHASGTEEADKDLTNISTIFLGMKIDREKPTKARSNERVSQYQSDTEPPFRERISKSPVQRDRMLKAPQEVPYQKMDLFGYKPLGIFENIREEGKIKPKTLWQQLEEENLNLLVTQPPVNGFEEMILWTEQGKLWHFPINNEFGMDEEAKVGFEEHVFLEPLLEGFPTKGPICHFMELVVIGLSKNPYITVERKRENIEWFRQYFKEKDDILKQLGAFDVAPPAKEEKASPS